MSKSVYNRDSTLTLSATAAAIAWVAIVVRHIYVGCSAAYSSAAASVLHERDEERSASKLAMH